MKKLLILLTSTLFFAVGCQTNTDITPSEEGFALSISLAPTRITLGNKTGDSYPAYWSDGDRLVVNGEQSDEAIIDANDRSKAVFKFSEATALSYPLNITYPYCATTTAEQPMVEFPAQQSYTKGSFEVGSAPMCGYVSSNEKTWTTDERRRERGCAGAGNLRRTGAGRG
jgi:hypothetical protein